MNARKHWFFGCSVILLVVLMVDLAMIQVVKKAQASIPPQVPPPTYMMALGGKLTLGLYNTNNDAFLRYAGSANDGTYGYRGAAMFNFSAGVGLPFQDLIALTITDPDGYSVWYYYAGPVVTPDENGNRSYILPGNVPGTSYALTILGPMSFTGR